MIPRSRLPKRIIQCNAMPSSKHALDRTRLHFIPGLIDPRVRAHVAAKMFGRDDTSPCLEGASFDPCH
jgi:hypothetical protein